MSEVLLAHGHARATIALAGAEARSWTVDGRDLLWAGDPAIWTDISPILYPVVGWTRDGARIDGRVYALGLHGFARFETFAVEASGLDFVRLSLKDNPRTRAVYPFAFALALEYRLTDDALGMTIEVANPGDEAAPYACGLHPGFRWPLGAAGRDSAFARFEKPEKADVPAIAPGGLIGAGVKRVPLNGRDLPLSDALVRQRRGLLFELREPLARLPRRLRRVGHDGVPGLRPRGALDPTRRAVRLPRGLDGLQRPGWIRRRPVRKAVDARACARRGRPA